MIISQCRSHSRYTFLGLCYEALDLMFLIYPDACAILLKQNDRHEIAYTVNNCYLSIIDSMQPALCSRTQFLYVLRLVLWYQRWISYPRWQERVHDVLHYPSCTRNNDIGY